jgi:hypothetical protein
MDIYELEHAGSAVVSFGGQLPQNIALKLQEVGGARILGTNPLVSSITPDFLSSDFLGIGSWTPISGRPISGRPISGYPISRYPIS